ncbi:TIGR02677 family protein [Streptomyces acidiscabies]|uniref:TIGR02677 family protein n=1 Tax=Streptomyces acidiscabies TaxID=42234 RepID=A0AAP6BB49_9ACTN|nr:TIGR02677 family protein [Streptomyces acidiscabies]MBP5935716.1 TIGR02677 family protein [Streptomyces sp. LBUM 1476]MBZ3916390.1 TIGR02677 family protein [Streptomyces acidiscabies]MDX2961237.1 TIGR02677 family protein [Streptomyces acidiscabies]MDX3022809.1 TIGR02677 family protein [Streptomyces acidiscabies]MDX3791944.1 TIGR02677 family protein [Streptomyces acidiscabies]
MAAFGGRMKIVAYLNHEKTLFYRLVLDVLLDEEARLGVHLSTEQIRQRVQDKLASEPELLEALPAVDGLLEDLYGWRNVDRIHNTRYTTTPEEYLQRDHLYQLTSAGARVHREMTRIDEDMSDAGSLQASMLPEVLASLAALLRAIREEDCDLSSTLGAFRRTTEGFVRLSEDAKLFVQGLGGSLASEEIRDTEAFIAYKNVVVGYLQSFTVVLHQSAAPIVKLIIQLERAGLLARLTEMAALEAAPVLGVSHEEVVLRDAQRMQQQWEGLRRWFVAASDRPPVAELLLDRASDAIAFIVMTIGHINDQRFRRASRTADLVALAGWFDGFDRTGGGRDTSALWRTAFGSYSSRHLGHPGAFEDDCDTGPEVGWWQSEPAPVSAELRSRGPRAHTGTPPRVRDPRRAKSLLAARQQQEHAATEAAERSLADRGPVRLSELGQLDSAEAEVFLTCLGLVLSTHRRSRGIRRARTPDGRLLITLGPAAEGAAAAVELRGGVLSTQDFELTLLVDERGRR